MAVLLRKSFPVPMNTRLFPNFSFIGISDEGLSFNAHIDVMGSDGVGGIHVSLYHKESLMTKDAAFLLMAKFKSPPLSPSSPFISLFISSSSS